MRVPAFLVACAVWCGAALAQSPGAYSPPRTPSGSPDFQGVWSTKFLTPLERPQNIPGPVAPPDSEGSIVQQLALPSDVPIDPDFFVLGASALVRVRGEPRTSMIVEPLDGQLPYTATGLSLAARELDLFENGYDNPEERQTYDRCIAGGLQAPIRIIPAWVPWQIVQTPAAILIVTEDVQGARIIDMSGHAPPDGVRSREGYSAGHWEGDVLVVVTTHLREDDPFRSTMARAIVVSGESRIVERFERVSETELAYRFTVEDPDIYSQSWWGEFSFTAAPDDRVLEYACHEGNYSLANMLKFGRVRDARSARGKR